MKLKIKYRNCKKLQIIIIFFKYHAVFRQFKVTYIIMVLMKFVENIEYLYLSGHFCSQTDSPDINWISGYYNYKVSHYPNMCPDKWGPDKWGLYTIYTYIIFLSSSCPYSTNIFKHQHILNKVPFLGWLNEQRYCVVSIASIKYSMPWKWGTSIVYLVTSTIEGCPSSRTTVCCCKRQLRMLALPVSEISKIFGTLLGFTLQRYPMLKFCPLTPIFHLIFWKYRS